MSVRHENTKTSRNVREIEDKLAKSLNAISRNIEKEPHHIVSQLYTKYRKQVEFTIQSAVQQIYLAGVNYVADYHDIPPLLTSSDLSSIEAQASDRVNSFWHAITKTSIREVFEQDRPSFDRAAMMSALATMTATVALNKATINKAGEIAPDESVFVWKTEVDGKVCPICRPLEGKRWLVNDPNLLTPGEDSHPNCRCRLLFIDGRQAYSH